MLGTQPKIRYIHYDYIKIRKILFAHLFFSMRMETMREKVTCTPPPHTYTHTKEA